MDDRTTNPQRVIATLLTRAPAQTSGSSNSGCLVVIYGSEIGKRIELTEAECVFGRSEACTVSLDDDSCSRRHARIFYDDAGFNVEDLGSTNGTFVNDVTIKSVVLRDGDQIKIGRSIMKFMSGSNVELEYHEVIYKLMTVDGLTEVSNRRHFTEVLDRETSRCRRYSRMFSVVVFDIDFFKKINDTHGHLAGDAVLRQLGAVLQQNVRRDDTAARIGGEEFAVVLPEIDCHHAALFAEKLRKVVEVHPFRFEQKTISVTLSLGVAEFDKSFVNVDDIVKKADERLYAAKRGGRNQVVSG